MKHNVHALRDYTNGERLDNVEEVIEDLEKRIEALEEEIAELRGRLVL